MNLNDPAGLLETLSLVLAAVLVLILPIELIWLRRSGRLTRQRVREMVASGVQAIPQNLSVIPIFALWGAVFVAVGNVVPWEIAATPFGALAAVILTDFLYYWEHRAGHRVNLLWSTYHSVHHSSPVYDQTTALRLSVLDGLLSTSFYLPLAFVGFPTPLIIGALGVVVAYQTWVHTDLVRTLPRPLEWLLNTPSHHRVHHGSNPEYIDKNYGGVLMLWDRWFGTFEPERAPVTYGLTTQIGTTRWLDVQLFEIRRLRDRLRRAGSWSERLGVLLRPPTSEGHEMTSTSAS